MILILENGERRLVGSLNGHEDATVLADNVPDPPVWAKIDDLGDDGLPLVDVLKTRMKLAVKAIMEGRYAGGWTHDFSIGTRTLDLRPGTDDKANWTLRLMKLSAQVPAGQTTLPIRFRAQDNSEFFIPSLEAYQALSLFLVWGEATLDHKWDLEALIDAAATAADLDAIDVAAGWPQ